ncbi:G-protein coupled receptor 12 [Merluccius polli]|uniref:G-protein coupled receptor 12 n=1 Tax=Merluccius polli TaxID=89951 RepID=A0AA47NZD4_MERPO|nr:G-protein coupled receptor 12 [Merluccius polli]
MARDRRPTGCRWWCARLRGCRRRPNAYQATHWWWMVPRKHRHSRLLGDRGASWTCPGSGGRRGNIAQEYAGLEGSAGKLRSPQFSEKAFFSAGSKFVILLCIAEQVDPNTGDNRHKNLRIQYLIQKRIQYSGAQGKTRTNRNNDKPKTEQETRAKIQTELMREWGTAMILSLAATAAVSGGGLNSSLDPFDSSTWGFAEDPSSNSSSSNASSSSSSSLSSSPDPSLMRTLTPDDLLLRPPPPLPLQEVSPWDVALCVTGTLISCENALVLAVLFYTPTLRAPMFVLIGSLAAADLLAGVGLILNFVCAYLLDGSAELATLLSAGLLIAAFSASVLNILAITVDRYLSLYNALTYHTERTLTVTYVMVLLVWLSGAALGLLPALGWNCLRDASACSVCRPVTRGNAVALAVAFLLVFALMTQLYLQICKIAFRHAQQIAVQHQFLAISTTKGVSTLSAILCAFGACWLPFATYSIVADSSYPAAYTYAAVLPATCCSVLNPVIYAFRNPDIQKSLWMACCGCVPSNLSLRPRTSSDV